MIFCLLFSAAFQHLTHLFRSRFAVAIVETLGSYSKIAPPGLTAVCCPFQNVAGRLSLRVQQLDIKCETKTKDNVFVDVSCSVQYQVILDEVYNSFYR